jgi:hypothetical protein
MGCWGKGSLGGNPDMVSEGYYQKCQAVKTVIGQGRTKAYGVEIPNR